MTLRTTSSFAPGASPSLEQLLDALRAPVQERDVHWRLEARSADGVSGRAVPYVSALAVRERLDEVLGAANWQVSYQNVEGGALCRLSIRCGREWLSKDAVADLPVVGSPSPTGAGESPRGGYTQAFVLAAAVWGIGRYLELIEAPTVQLTAEGEFAEPPELPPEALSATVERQAAPAQQDMRAHGSTDPALLASAQAEVVSIQSTRVQPAVGGRQAAPAAAPVPEAESLHASPSDTSAPLVGTRDEWEALDAKAQNMAGILLERIRKGVALATIEEYLVDGGGKGFPTWLQSALLERLAERVGVQPNGAPAAIEDVATT